MSSSNTPAKRSRSDSNGKPSKKQRLSASSLVPAPNLHVYSQYIDAKEASIIDNIDEIHEEDIPAVILAATDDIDFYKKTIAELQEKLTFCKTQVGLCGQLLGQLISRNASRVDLKKLLSPQSNDTPPRKKGPTSPVSLPPFSPSLTDTSISSQLTPSGSKRATTPTNKTVTRSVSAAERGHERKKSKSAVHTQISSDTSSSDEEEEDEPRTPMQIEATKASPRGRVAANTSLEPNLFLTDNKIRSVTVETSAYILAHEMKPRSLIFNPHRTGNFTTASFDGSVKFWQFNENYISGKDDEEDQMIQTGIITGKHMKHTRPPADINWSKWEERLAILFPYATSDQKGTNCQLVLVEASRMPTVSGLFLNTRPHTKDPLCVRWVSRNKLVSGGLDHSICSWNVNYEAKSCETSVVHTNHSSGVTAIHVLDDYIYSGGSDKKLICWNMKTETEVQHLKLDEKITSITPCPAQEKIFLVSKMSHSSQLAIFDSRTSKAELTLSYKAGVRNSSYVTPSWDSSGTWVCCGSTEPLLNLWDLRYSDANFPAYSWKMHKSRIFKAEFVPNENKILTLSSDHYLGCHQLTF